MFTKILVANRGEIAIRAFRAAYELGAQTVAVFPYEDRNSMHRLKADEAYQIGEKGHPVRAYLDVAEIIRVAQGVRRRRDLPRLRLPLREPRPRRGRRRRRHHLHRPGRARARDGRQQGDREGARDRRGRAGAEVDPRHPPTSRSCSPAPTRSASRSSRRPSPAAAGAACAASTSAEDLREALEAAMREADSAFGDPTMFLEQAVVRPRHIEVQILADADGRDRAPVRARLLGAAPPPEGRRDRAGAEPRRGHPPGDVPRRDRVREVDRLRQRRHRRVPARHRGGAQGPARLHRDEPAHPGRAHGHRGGHRRRPRAVADAHRRGRDPRRPRPRSRTNLHLRGAALQCRITTEDPAAGLPPRHRQDHDLPLAGRRGHPPRRRHDHRRRADLAALRLDAREDDLPRPRLRRGRRRAPSAVSPSSGCAASRRTSRSCRPCSTTPTSLAGDSRTSFIEERPWLVRGHQSKDRGTKILNWLADVTVNQPNGNGGGLIDPAAQAARRRPRRRRRPPARASGCSSSARSASPRALRAQTALAVTETTFRDAHQSLLATRVRTRDLVAVLPHVARLTPAAALASRPGAARPTTSPCASSARTRGSGSPTMREALPNIAIQMLLRGRNTVGYTPYPTEVTDAFVREAAATGVDIFRIFDALNDVDADAPGDRRRARDRHRRRRGRALLHRRPARPRRDALHARLLPAARRADRRRRRAHPRDQGHGGAAARRRRREARRPRCASASTCPVHVHTHDTAGGQLATLLAASRAGADAVDVASAPMAGTTSQPSPPRSSPPSRTPSATPGSRSQAVSDLEPYWEAVRHVYKPFESGLPGPDRPRVQARDPGRPALEPAPAGDRARPRRPVREDRGPVRGGQPRSSAARRRSRRRRRSSATSRSRSPPRTPTRPTSRRTRRSTTSPTR